MKKLVCILISLVMCMVSQNFTVVAEANQRISVSAKSSILIEAKTGRVLFSKNAETKFSVASTTKIMTTLLCLESGGLDEEFVVDPNAIKVEGSTMGLTEGDIVTKRALCYGMMLPSGNDAANATAIKIAGSYEGFAGLMNERAKEIGMTRTCFVTPSGLEAAGHGSSATDMALLTSEALRNPEFREICSQQSAKLRFGNPPYERWLNNTNKLLGMYPGVIGVKTGFTDEAGRCLISACERNGITLICVTFDATNDWQDHIALYDMGFPLVSPKTIGLTEGLDIDIVGSEVDSIAIGSEETITIGMIGDESNKITTKAILPPFSYAPVTIGDEIGKLEFYYEDRYIDSIPLYMLESAELFELKQEESKLDKFLGKIKRALGM